MNNNIPEYCKKCKNKCPNPGDKSCLSLILELPDEEEDTKQIDNEQAIEILEGYRQNNSNFNEEIAEAIDFTLNDNRQKDKVIELMAKDIQYLHIGYLDGYFAGKKTHIPTEEIREYFRNKAKEMIQNERL